MCVCLCIEICLPRILILCICIFGLAVMVFFPSLLERKWWVNGAYMSFDKGHAFVKNCLQSIPRIYDPYDWGTIGPSLLSKMTKNNPNSPTIHPRVSCLLVYLCSCETQASIISVAMVLVRSFHFRYFIQPPSPACIYPAILTGEFLLCTMVDERRSNDQGARRLEVGTRW